MTAPEDIPEPDRLPGAPHPREALTVFGQDAAEAVFLDAWNSGRMHSGWLLTGPKGIGKATMAYRIAAFLLADEGDDASNGLFGAPPPPQSLDIAAGHPVWRQIRARAHPRLFVVRRPWDEKGERLRGEITVEAVRGLKDFFHLSAADGGRRVVIVDCADEMNSSAANAILKELEEPPARATILLLSHQPSRLLPTIRSRCRELRLSPLATADVEKVLHSAGVGVDYTDAVAALADGSAGAAITLIADGGIDAYAEIVALFSGLPLIDRQAALKLAESCAGKGAEHRFPLIIGLAETFMARAARAGLQGPSGAEGAPGEAALFSRIARGPAAARGWADLHHDLSSRLRAGRAVNLDPAALILDMVFRIEHTAKGVAAA